MIEQAILQIMNSGLSFHQEGGFDWTPEPDFLSNIAAFEAAIIALAVPLSFQMVSRISERYESDVITRQFLSEWAINLFPMFLIINILLAITLRVAVDGEPVSLQWKILAWIIFGLFVVVLFILGEFIQ